MTRHPGRLNPAPTNIQIAPEAFLLHRFQKVSISGHENDDTERWYVREAPLSDDEISLMSEPFKDFNTKKFETNRQSGEYFEEVKPEPRTRLSDITSSKLTASLKTRYASDPELHRSETPVSTKIDHNMIHDPQKTHHVEEELYIKGNTLTWSRGLMSTPDTEYQISDSRITLCMYTLDNRITHALWCTFYSNRPKLDLTDVNITTPTTQNHLSKPFRCITVMDATTLRVFAEQGEDFITNLQGPISNVWASNFGLILEKDFTDSGVACIFSLSHPLDEMSPVAIKQPGGSVQLANEASQQIVFVNEDPSLCMIFDKKTGLHSIYTLRGIRPGEFQDINNSMSTSGTSYQSSVKQKGNSVWHLGLGAPLAAGSPYWNRNSVISPQPARSPMASVRFVLAENYSKANVIFLEERRIAV